MSQQEVDAYLSRAQGLIEDAGIPCQKWFNAYKHERFPWPVLLFAARDRDFGAVTSERNRHVKGTPQYANARDRVTQARAQAGEDYRSTARQLGHQEIGGKFAFENDKGHSKGFMLGVDCLLCGLHGHEIEQCQNFLRAYQTLHGRPYDSHHQALSSFPNNGISGSDPNPTAYSNPVHHHQPPFHDNASLYSNITIHHQPIISHNSSINQVPSQIPGSRPPISNYTFPPPHRALEIEGSFKGFARLNDDGTLTLRVSGLTGTATGVSGNFNIQSGLFEVEGGIVSEQVGQAQDSRGRDEPFEPVGYENAGRNEITDGDMKFDPYLDPSLRYQ